MKKTLFLIKLLIVYLFFVSNTFADKTKFFSEGKILFDKKEFEKSKIFFEKDIVFNPKSEKSYIYLAKIFDISDSVHEQEMNLSNVLLLNPQNDEALYMLALLKIKQSDYKQAKDLIKKFDLVCEFFCYKKTEIQEKFNKLTPENVTDNN